MACALSRLVRSEYGAPLVVDCWALEVDVAPEFDPLAYRRDWLPNHLFPPPVQREMSGTPPPDSDSFALTGLTAGRSIVRCRKRGRASFVHGRLEFGEREVRAGLGAVALGACAGVVGLSVSRCVPLDPRVVRFATLAAPLSVAYIGPDGVPVGRLAAVPIRGLRQSSDRVYRARSPSTVDSRATE